MTNDQPPGPGVDFFTATDARRAVALLAHAARGDLPGMRAILTEAADAGAGLDLAAALAATTLDLMPALRTPAGGQALADLATVLAAAEAGPS